MSKTVNESSFGSKLTYRITTYLRDHKTMFKWQIVDNETGKVLMFSPGSWDTESEALASLIEMGNLIQHDTVEDLKVRNKAFKFLKFEVEKLREGESRAEKTDRLAWQAVFIFMAFACGVAATFIGLSWG